MFSRELASKWVKEVLLFQSHLRSFDMLRSCTALPSWLRLAQVGSAGFAHAEVRVWVIHRARRGSERPASGFHAASDQCFENKSHSITLSCYLCIIYM